MNKLIYTGPSSSIMNPNPSIIINNDNNNPFKFLSVDSTEFPFQKGNTTYHNILQYIYYHISSHKELLWESNPHRLRVLYNRLSNIDFKNFTKDIIYQVIAHVFRNNKDFRTEVKILSEEGQRGFYYITNQNSLWGVNESGYGYNFIGLTYSKLVNRYYSSYYIFNKSNIALIFKCSKLLIQHFQSGHDIAEFIGTPCQEIFQKLYPFITEDFQDDDEIWLMYMKQYETTKWIQMELDYPLNLAGFIRAEYIRYFNFYLRNRFHKTMISKYFIHLIHSKYSHVITDHDVSYHVQKLYKNMSTSYLEKLANKLYYIYNDPGTTDKLDIFLDYETRTELYDIETQFKTGMDIENIENYTPFLYHAPKESSMYIYNTQEEFFELFEPYTTHLSPSAPHEFMKPRLSMMQEIFIKLISIYGNIPEEKVFEKLNIPTFETSYGAFEKVLTKVSSTRTSFFVRQAYNLKVRQNPILRFSVFNTSIFKDDVIISDSDPIIQETATTAIFDIRKELTAPFYAISLYLTDDIYLQDRIRFRLEDFQYICKNYVSLLTRLNIQSSEQLSWMAFSHFETTIYHDPMSFFTENTSSDVNPIPVFREYFKQVCDTNVQKHIWAFIQNYIKEYKNYCRVKKDCVFEKNALKRSVCIFISNLINTILKETELQKQSSIEGIFEFICACLRISNKFSINPIYTTSLPSSIQEQYNVMKDMMDFSKIPANFGLYVCRFLVWVQSQKISDTHVQFLGSIRNGIFAKTPIDYSLKDALTPFIVEKIVPVIKMTNKKPDKNSSSNKKKKIESIMASTTLTENPDENPDDNDMNDEDMSDILKDLGLDDDDEEQEENDNEEQDEDDNDE